jgi:hypothetical protein
MEVCGGWYANRLRHSALLEVSYADGVSNHQGHVARIVEPDAADHFEWPEALDRCALASTAAFVSWLKEVNETSEMSWRHLKTLYLEYCCIARRNPLSDRRLQIGLKKNGVVSSRTKLKVKGDQLHRPSVYLVCAGN